MKRSLRLWLLVSILGSFYCSFCAAQNRLYADHPLLINILNNTTKIPTEKTNNQKISKDTNELFIIHSQASNPSYSKHINLYDSIQAISEVEQMSLSYLDNPLYGLYTIEIIEKKLPSPSLNSSLEQYKKAISELYQDTYNQLSTIPLEDRLFYGNDSNFVNLATAYDLAYRHIDSSNYDTEGRGYPLFFANKLPNYIKSTSPQHQVLDTQSKNYLEHITAQSTALKAGFEWKTTRHKGINPLLYWAIGGVLLGAVLSILYHQFYWKQ